SGSTGWPAGAASSVENAGGDLCKKQQRKRSAEHCSASSLGFSSGAMLRAPAIETFAEISGGVSSWCSRFVLTPWLWAWHDVYSFSSQPFRNTGLTHWLAAALLLNSPRAWSHISLPSKWTAAAPSTSHSVYF